MDAKRAAGAIIRFCLLIIMLLLRPPLRPRRWVRFHSSLRQERILTLPNALTVGRIVACPFLGYSIVHGDFAVATGILAAGGFTDWVCLSRVAPADQLDGYLARRWRQHTVLGSILDPAADKALMTTLVGTLAWVGMLPREYKASESSCSTLGCDHFWTRPGTVSERILHPICIAARACEWGRGIGLTKKTLARYFSPSTPSAEVQPTQISKVQW